MKIAPVLSVSLALLCAFGCSNVAGTPADAGPTCITNPIGDAGVASEAGADDDDDDAGDDGGVASACLPGDADGINGGCYAFTVTVDDTGFSPVILKAENTGQVSITLKNVGTKSHDFTVGCIATANLRGCPAQTCFPSASQIPPVAPGGSATASFVTPNPEGIYLFRSDVSGDSTLESDGGATGLWGQFVIQ